jgi:hypothetical protein
MMTYWINKQGLVFVRKGNGKCDGKQIRRSYKE